MAIVAAALNGTPEEVISRVRLLLVIVHERHVLLRICMGMHRVTQCTLSEQTIRHRVTATMKHTKRKVVRMCF